MTQDSSRKLLNRRKISEKARAFAAVLLLSLASAPLQAQQVAMKTADEKSQRTLFMQAAREYLGTPYRTGGTDRSGMDCSGLVYRAALDGLGAEVPRTARSLAAAAERIDDGALEGGDLVFFNTTGTISHVGIYLGGGTFIHSASDGPRTGVIVSSLSEAYWKRTYVFAGRILSPEGIKIPTEPGETAPAVNPFPFTGNLGFRINTTANALWDLWPGEIPLRGASLGAEAQWVNGSNLYPGAGFGVSWDERDSALSVPLYLSLTGMRGFRFFIGTQLHVIADRGLNKDPQFPGILGGSWTSKPTKVFGQNLRFYQGVEYSWFPDETFGQGFRFSTGITVTFDI